MPLEDIQAVLHAPDLETRNHVLSAHLARLENLAGRRTPWPPCATCSNRPPPPRRSPSPRERPRAAAITRRRHVATPSPGTRVRSASWRHAGCPAPRRVRPGRGGLRRRAVRRGAGEATVFVPPQPGGPAHGPSRPVDRPGRRAGRHRPPRPPRGIDRAYGALASLRAQHALGIDGPIREYYLVGRHDTDDERRGAPRSAGPSSAPGQPPGRPHAARLAACCWTRSRSWWTTTTGPSGSSPAPWGSSWPRTRRR